MAEAGSMRSTRRSEKALPITAAISMMSVLVSKRPSES